MDRDSIRASWGAEPDTAVVLFCAKLQAWKRPLDLVQAFAKANVTNSLLLLAGDGPLKEELQSEVARLGISDRVRFLGFVNQTQLPALYTAADVMVLPSEYDACPVVVCEAMLCGCPVVISDQIRGRFDLVRHGLTGDIFPCGDVDALSAVLKRLLLDRAGLGTLAANARRRMETWSPREYITGVVAALERAVSRIQPASWPGHCLVTPRHSRDFLSVLKSRCSGKVWLAVEFRLFAVHCQSPHRATPQCR